MLKAKNHIWYMFCGIDGRDKETGIFRLNKEGRYVDNKSFREDGTFYTVSLEDIQKMITDEKMPATLSSKIDYALKNGFIIPSEIIDICDHLNKMNEPDKEILETGMIDK